MEANDPDRQIPASSARRQTDEAPDKRPRVAATGGGKKAPLSGYPETIKGTEPHISYQAQTPLRAYPIVSDRPNYDPNDRGSMGKVRTVYNDADRSKFDVVYQDPTREDDNSGNYSQAPYRGATHRDGRPVTPPVRAPQASSSRYSDDEDDWATSKKKKGKGNSKK